MSRRFAAEYDSVTREISELMALSRRITAALVTIAVVAMVFTAASVTLFAIEHGVSVWIAWTLDPMVAGALLTVLLVDARLVELGTAPSGWATALRWFAGMGTWVMNVWSSVWPDGDFGVPSEVDAAGVVLHSIPPVLLIVLAEAATGYRRVIADRIRFLEGRATLQNVRVPVVPVVAPVVVPPAPTGPVGYRPDDRQVTAAPVVDVVVPVAVGPVVPAVVETVETGTAGDRSDDRVERVEPDVDVVVPVVVEAVTAGPVPDVAPADEPDAFAPAPERMTDAELKRRARRMHADAVKATRKPVTVDALRTDLGLSRRAATDLRREVVMLNGVARS